ncbi:MAG: hypothetical protein JW861_07290 [Bacteroidales bacterium]|nr:hypothetical protein [Bacteroidales bacterium]
MARLAHLRQQEPLTSTPLGERASRRSAYTPSAGKPAGRGGTIDPSSEEPD